MNSERRFSPSALSRDSISLPLDEEVFPTFSVGCEVDSEWASIEGNLSGSMESCLYLDLSGVKIDLSCLIVFSASLRATSTMDNLLKTSANWAFSLSLSLSRSRADTSIPLHMFSCTLMLELFEDHISLPSVCLIPVSPRLLLL